MRGKWRSDNFGVAFRDREAGREHNRSKPVDPNGPTQGEGPRRGGRGGARGGAGGGRGRPGNREYDRRSGTGKVYVIRWPI